MSLPATRYEPLGDRAVLVRLGDRIDPAVHRAVGRLTGAIRRAAPNGVTDVVPAYTTVGVWYDPARSSYAELVETLGALALTDTATPESESRLWRIPTRYHGPDLAAVAERIGMPAEEVVERHSARTYEVLLVGFVPGFAFLGELDPRLVLPRRDSPRRRVPAGSVAIAGAQTGIYPLETPGGWHLLGRTDLTLFDPNRDPPALLRVGDRVHFDPIP